MDRNTNVSRVCGVVERGRPIGSRSSELAPLSICALSVLSWFVLCVYVACVCVCGHSLWYHARGAGFSQAQAARCKRSNAPLLARLAYTGSSVGRPRVDY